MWYNKYNNKMKSPLRHKEVIIMNELMRANKVTVKLVKEGFVADFYKTHKHITSIKSVDTDWTANEDMSKIGQRESYREYAMKNAENYGILWSPADMRSDENKRKPVYKTDNDLIDDVIISTAKNLQDLVEKCKYGVKWGGIDVDEIIPKRTTARGTNLAQLGIENGKYKNTGNWAWADIKCAITVKYKKSEIYIPVLAELVSGQLKKPKMNITTLTDMIKTELVDAGITTIEELEPPKENKKKNTEDKEVVKVIKRKPGRPKKSK